MKPKTDKPKTKSKDEEEFYQFAKALMAVPKEELDKEIAKDERKKKDSQYGRTRHSDRRRKH